MNQAEPIDSILNTANSERKRQEHTSRYLEDTDIRDSYQGEEGRGPGARERGRGAGLGELVLGRTAGLGAKVQDLEAGAGRHGRTRARGGSSPWRTRERG